MLTFLRRYSYLFYSAVDVCLIFIAFYSASIAFKEALALIFETPVIGVMFYAIIHVSLFYFARQYTHLWKYAGLKDYAKVYLFSLLTGTVYIATGIAIDPSFQSVIMSVFVTTIFANLVILSRIFLKFLQREKVEKGAVKLKLALIGAGNTTASLLAQMATSNNIIYDPVCLFDDDELKHGKTINGVKVIGYVDEAPAYCKENGIKDIIIAIPSASALEKNKIINILSESGCNLSIIPSVEELIAKGGNSWSAIREVRIEDLLGRETINIIEPSVKSYVEGKVVLVTGGGGSIGSELCRQIAVAKPKKLVILDIYENSAFEIQQELIRTYGSDLNLAVEIASVRDAKKIDRIFDRHKPQIVYHAAAHKHVSLMETNPEEAIKNNIFGTYNAVNSADKHKAEKFVLISSDKAVNPTNVMGATKRFCEMIVQSMKDKSKTEFAAVRFGNVLGSNGSVVPLFKKQIAMGGPVTVTHKDIIRYFMTIPEAVQLVLITASTASSGNVYVLDMGEPIRIDDFARKMIGLSGLVPEKDIEIKYIGLKPGEKLYEELLLDNNTSTKTQNDKIFQETLPPIAKSEVEACLKDFKSAISDNDIEACVDALKKSVWTFHHNGDDNKYYTQEQSAGREKSIGVTRKVYVSKD